MIKKLTAQSKAELTFQITTLKLLLDGLLGDDHFPLTTVSGMELGSVSVFASPSTVSALPGLASLLLPHLLLHLTQVFFLLLLQLVFVKASKPSSTNLRDELDARSSD